jgi:hypothetical protein
MHMKKQLLYLFLLLITANTIFAQITNTFPLDDSVGIGTTTPQELLHVHGNMRVGWMGQSTLGGEGSVVFGLDALSNYTTSNDNVAIGIYSMKNTTTGSINVAVGSYTLEDNTIGESNTALGRGCLSDNVAGNQNTAVGVGALTSNKNSSYNTAVGASSMSSSFNGDYCAALGHNSLFSNTKGDYNTALGAEALGYNKSGNNNTAVGYDADVSLFNLNNATALGNGALVDASNKVRIGNSSVTSNGGQVSWTAYSDARIKTDVKENVPGLDFINLLKPVTYHFDVDKQNEIMGISINEKVEGMYDIEKITFTGFLAQDVEAAAKKVNYDFSGLDKSGEILGLRYAEFVVPLVKAVQELSIENEGLKDIVQEINNENQNLKAENENFESRITQLEKLITKQGIIINDVTTEELYKQSAIIENETGAATLAQNVPNPFTGNTSIAYFVPETAQQAHIKIANANGVSLFMAEVRLGNGVLEVDATQLTAGTYSYTLIVDSKVVDTKLMVIQ